MRNNLQLFRAYIKQQIPSTQIQSEQQFKRLINSLCDVKLLHPQEVKKLINKITGSNSDIKFPINIHQLEQIIMTSFGDSHLKQMLTNLNTFKKTLRQTKGVISIWREKGLTKQQRSQLQSIFQKGNSKLRSFYDILQIQKKQIESICEQDLQMIDSLDEWIKTQKIQNFFPSYKEYQKSHQKLIQQLFSKLRVREVHFKQRKNTAKVANIQIMTGLDSKNDEPVQVTLIPKKSIEFQVLNIQLLTFNAKKQLMLSQHFSRFLGYNTHSDSHCFFYFSQFISGQNLQQFISNSKIQLQEETPLFKYWTCTLYKSLYDIFIMCSYLPRLPIQLKNIQVSNSGLKLILKNIKFVGDRQQAQNQFYQAELLQNLGNLIMNLLKINKQNWNSQIKIKKIQNISVINCLNNATVGHKNYRQGRVKSLISFFSLQTHPLFENLNLMQGQTVVDNYQAILNY